MQYKERFIAKQKSNWSKGLKKFLERSPEQEDERKKKTSVTMKAKIAAEPWRKEKMRETAAATITKWSKSDEGRAHSQKHGTNVLSQKYKSMPEQVLFELVNKKFDGVFTHGRLIQNNRFTSPTKKRQGDIVSLERKIAIEFDGPFHFRPIVNKSSLAEKKIKDEEFNGVLSDDSWIVVRVAESNFSYKTKGFVDGCIEKICDIINSGISGVYKIGDEYDK